MNIQEAKEEISRTILAYTAKDPSGNYLIPQERQRPVFLMGAPGIGKTAIIEQSANECGLPFLSYTMTHHTRQSVIGLPMIREQQYGDAIFSSTVYTMSEILAEVYRIQEESGRKEGILFLDEINCVSETLLPTMLQFLQFKTFGTHRLPDGWIVAAAGNPPRYNRSAREFDVVTLDRLKYLELEPDLGTWLSYARQRNLHSTILSFLELHPEHFCIYTRSERGKAFVTPRSWEDLSAALTAYETLSLPVSEKMAGEFLHSEEVSRAFASYYLLCRNILQQTDLENLFSGESQKESFPDLSGLSSNEKLNLLETLRSRLFSVFRQHEDNRQVLRSLRYFSDTLKNINPAFPELDSCCEKLLCKRREANEKKKTFGLFSSEDERYENLFTARVREMVRSILTADHRESPCLLFSVLTEKAEQSYAESDTRCRNISDAVQTFVRNAFGDCPESYMFFTELSENPLIPRK